MFRVGSWVIQTDKEFRDCVATHLERTADGGVFYAKAVGGGDVVQRMFNKFARELYLQARCIRSGGDQRYE